MADVELHQLSKRFQQSPALKALDLKIDDGELLALVGPSGCGKSTTLELIAGLEPPSGGRVSIAGADVTALPPQKRDVAMVFQSYALYPHLDVRRNIAFPLENAKLPRAEIDQRVAETARLLELEPYLARRPRELSGGQRQRVALARALVRRPKVFLFDEPLSNLDAALRAQVRGELKSLHQQLRATFIYVTHDQVEAMTLPDRIAVLEKGELRQLGTPREIYDAPANLFVAGFFGAPRINLLPPRVLGLNRDQTTVGIRPEHLELGRGDPPPQALSGRVERVEPVGSETWVTVRVSDATLVARASADFDAGRDSAVWLRAQEQKLHWFDAHTGVRLPEGAQRSP
jgi:multiple sugar transport system ATP-binding protein